MPLRPFHIIRGPHLCNAYLRHHWGKTLDGAIVIAESLVRVVAAIRITSVRWWSDLPLKTQNLVLRPCVRCAAIRIARLAFIRLTFVPRGTVEWPARVGRVR